MREPGASIGEGAAKMSTPAPAGPSPSEDPAPRADRDLVTRCLVTFEGQFRTGGLGTLCYGYDTRYRQKARRVAATLAAALLTYQTIQIMRGHQLEPLLVYSLSVGIAAAAQEAYPGIITRPWRTKRASTLGWAGIYFVAFVIAGWVFGGFRTGIVIAVTTAVAWPAMALVATAVPLLLHVAGSIRFGLIGSLERMLQVFPTLFAATLIIFVTEDAWKLLGQMSKAGLVLTLGLFAILAGSWCVSRRSWAPSRA
ncbi:hypothetical protein ACGFJ7_13560 [Actinoplanes sp. NPDC048988]|uniref:hypothetical protein n=1 Tax=Actinoplanes sp. NPDC048988 TaxID=3363901 RepID=UPI00371F876C